MATCLALAHSMAFSCFSVSRLPEFVTKMIDKRPNERLGFDVICQFGIRAIHFRQCICEGCFANYRVAVGPLVGQGWEPKRPTLPMWRILSFKAVGLGLFLFVSSYENVGWLWV